MPNRDIAVTGVPSWLQVSTPDVQKTLAFYGSLFDWGVDGPDEEMGGYFNFLREGARIAGGSPIMQEGAPALWLTYLAVENLDATLAAADANGGIVHVPPMEIAKGDDQLGRMAFIGDPAGGAMIGLWEAGSHPGFQTFGEHGSPGWFELHTREYDRTLEFYRAVFGWKTELVSDAAEFRYTTFGPGDGLQYGGVVDDTRSLPADVPSHWQVYFATSDTGATARLIEELGGTVVQRDPETPYGDLAVCRDDLGIAFNLVGPNEQMPMNG